MWFWRYELHPRGRLSAVAGTGARHGALIRVGEGYADVHPWPELGDAPLEEQLARLARGETTSLTRRSLKFASIDGDARMRGVNLFDGLTIPESHWPEAAGDVPAAFDTVKIKMRRGASIDPAVSRFRLRLDYNATLTPAEFLDERLPRDSIDFIEDPCPFDRATWAELRRRSGLRLALDRGTDDDMSVDVLVVKPAVQDVPHSAKEIVVTSYMDHSIGQLAAAWVAAGKATSARCGLLTHLLFELDPFFERLRIDGARLVAPAGTGLGFDDLLVKLPWKKLE
jgi:o-succinylbenzoate synthase